MSLDQPSPPDVNGQGFVIAIVAARFNEFYVNKLRHSATETLVSCGVDPEDIELVRVPGSYETVYAANMLAMTDDFDAILVLGVVIAGDTDHHNVLARSTSEALLKISTEHRVPVINGILTVENEEQAVARCNPPMDRGREFAYSTLEMAALSCQLDERVDQYLEEAEGNFPYDFLDGDGEEPWKS
jgi:6,7-dimethyl-8-ribityllumazine synthase